MNIEVYTYRVRIGLFNSARIPCMKKSLNSKPVLFNIDQFKIINLFVNILLIFFSIFKFPLVTITILAAFSLLTLSFGIYMPIFLAAYSGRLNVRLIIKLLILGITLCCLPVSCIYLMIPYISKSLICCGDIETNPGPDAKTNVKILFSNINSISADETQRFECLKLRVHSEDCNVILLNETGILSKEVLKNSFSIPGFHEPYILPRGRGIIVYVSETFPLNIRHDLMNDNLDCIWIEISGLKDNNTTLIGVTYRSPNQKAEDRKIYFKNLEQNLRLVRNFHNNKNHSIILLGDLNSKNKMFWRDDITDTAGRELYKLISNVAFQNLIHEPTRIKDGSSSCIDLVLTDSPGKFQNVSVSPPIGRTDHSTIIASLDTSFTCEKVTEKIIWQYNKCNLDLLNNEILNFNWNRILESGHNIDTIVDNFTEKLFNIYKKLVPSKNITIKSNDQPWINNHIKKELKIRDRLYHKMKKSKTQQDYRTYSEKCIEIKNLIRDRKESYKSSLIDNLDDSNSNSKGYYNLLKKFLGNKFPSNIPTLVDPITKVYSISNLDKSNTLLKIFAAKNHIDPRLEPLPHFPLRTNFKLNNITTTEEEVLRYLNSLDVTKASGIDQITNKMLKISAISICKPLSNLINKIFQCKNYPKLWKKGIVIPVHKKDKKDNPQNYRPITLLSCVSKICEKIIFDRMYSHINTHNLLYPQQSGFVRGHSTHDQLIAIVNHIHENFEMGYSVKAIFLDITAAFDSVPHDLLLVKLKGYGFDGPLIDLLSSYLKNRQIQVRVNASYSNFTSEDFINAGVAQGSLLGPLMFLLYINDLPDNIKSNMFLYADDSSLYCKVDHDNYQTSINELQNDLDTIGQWAKTWGLEFKASKSWDLTFHSTSKKLPTLPSMKLNNIIIPKTPTHKHLGIILDEHLNFAAHIDELARKYQNMVNALRPLSWQLNSRHLDKIYNTYILPILDHGDILYASASDFQLSKLDRIHYRAACYVSGAIRGSNSCKVLDNLNWHTLENRRKYHSANYIYKAQNNMKPSYIINIVDKHRNQPNQNYNFRRTRTFQFPNNSTRRFLNSPQIQLLKTFNSIPEQVRTSTSLEIFKTKIKKLFFDTHIHSPTTKLKLPRLNEILINRIRAGLLLNSSRYSHNFQDTPNPLCRCGSVQNERHLFFNCTLIDNHRNTLLRTLTSLGLDESFNNLSIDCKIKFLVFGNNLFNINLNNQIILATSNFLNSSKHLFHMKSKKQNHTN